MGPGFITGAADDDPSGIATYSQAGAQFGYRQLWTSLFSFPFMAAIQEMSGRIGLVTGRGLSKVIKEHYGRPILFFAVLLLVTANTVNIGADLGAMASAVQLLAPIPFIVILLLFTALILFLEIFITYRTYAKFLKYLALFLLAYVFAALIVNENWAAVWSNFLVPTILFNKDYLLNIAAVLGTTISPYLFFWQSDEEVEEEVANNKLRGMNEGKPRFNKRDVRDMRIDTVFGMFFSNFIMFFIILTTAATLGRAGLTDIDTAAKAALALRPIAGDSAFLLFTLGVIGVGLLAVPVLAGSASYAVAEALGLKEGLYKKFREAHGFYGVITLATVVGLVVNFLAVPPFRVLYYAAILNGVLAPPLLVLMMFIANNRKIMGQHVNSRFSNFLGWIITFVMAGIALVLVKNLIFG